MAIVRTACTMTLDPKDLDEVVGIESFIKDVQEKTTACSPTTTSSTRTHPRHRVGTRARRRCSTTTPTSIDRAAFGAIRPALPALLRQPDAGGGGPDGRVRRGPHPPSAGEHPGDRRAGVVTQRRIPGGIATGAGSGRGRAFCPCSDRWQAVVDAAGIGEETSLLDLGCNGAFFAAAPGAIRRTGLTLSRILSHRRWTPCRATNRLGMMETLPWLTRCSMSSTPRSTPCSTRWIPSWPWRRRRASCGSVAGWRSASGVLRPRIVLRVPRGGWRQRCPRSAECGRGSARRRHCSRSSRASGHRRCPCRDRDVRRRRTGTVAVEGGDRSRGRRLGASGIGHRRGCSVPPGRRQLSVRQPPEVLDSAEVVSVQIARGIGPAGIDIAFERLGDPGAPPLLLIMGLGTQMIGWPDGFCEALADHGMHVIRFDNRDIGLFTHITDAPTVGAALTGITLGVIQAVGYGGRHGGPARRARHAEAPTSSAPRWAA